MREATGYQVAIDLVRDVSIHASHAGGDWSNIRGSDNIPVSIHASHAGGDPLRAVDGGDAGVSIHASHAGGDKGRGGKKFR